MINSMRRWRQSTGKGCYVKGFVIHSFLVKDLYLTMYNDKLDNLRQKLEIDAFPTTATVTACNPNQRIFLLITVAENEDVKNKIKLCGAELKMLMLIVG